MATMTKGGLEDVIATTSAICAVDGAQGKLYYRGYDIDDLATHATFEAVTYLLWHGELPTPSALAALRQELAAQRALAPATLALLRTLPSQAHPLAALRTVVSFLGLSDPDASATTPKARQRQSLRLTAQLPTLSAAWQRLHHGQEPVAPRADLGQAANYLYMLTGSEPSPMAARTMDVAFILQADHELNASTFAARVAAATEADLHGAVTAALATLKGPKHGGANEDSIHMFAEIGAPEHAAAWVQERLARRATLTPEQRQAPQARFPGFGHRVYKVDDPRAAHLRRLARELTAGTAAERWYTIGETVRAIIQRELGLPVNLDFYSALVYYALGIPTDYYTSVFACARIAGWTAHIMEQYAHNRLIRPRAQYIGPVPRPYLAG
jgi:citrate synthase